jgi:photosystem II stability/assembly factor-like uncharacterized protein
MMRKFRFLFILTVLLPMVWPQFTFTSEIATTLNWKSVASNNAANYLLAVAAFNGVNPGAAYKSNNSGSSWISVFASYAASMPITSCVLDSTGQHQMAGVSYAGVYTSSDYGINFLPRLSFGSGSTTLVNDMSISSSGQYALTATSLLSSGAGTVYYSSDYGATWLASTITGSGIIYGVSSDSTGQLAVACAAGGIYRSTSYGGASSWSQVYSNGAYSVYNKIASSSNGQYLICTAFNNPGAIIVSTNSGTSWTIELSLANAYSVAIHSTGQYAFVGVSGGYMYQSTDYGNTWSQITSNSQVWSNIAMLSSSTFLVSQDPGGNYFIWIFF